MKEEATGKMNTEVNDQSDEQGLSSQGASNDMCLTRNKKVSTSLKHKTQLTEEGQEQTENKPNEK